MTEDAYHNKKGLIYEMYPRLFFVLDRNWHAH